MPTISLLDAATGVGAGSTAQIFADSAAFQAVVVGSGSVSATVVIQVSLDMSNWLPLGTIALSGTASASDGFASAAPWAYVRASVTAISGTSAAVSVRMRG